MKLPTNMTEALAWFSNLTPGDLHNAALGLLTLTGLAGLALLLLWVWRTTGKTR